jgi:hypothetical protein
MLKDALRCYWAVDGCFFSLPEFFFLLVVLQAMPEEKSGKRKGFSRTPPRPLLFRKGLSEFR